MMLTINAEVQSSSYRKYHRASQYIIKQFENWNTKSGHDGTNFQVGFVPVILSKQLVEFSHTANDPWSYIDGVLYVGWAVDADEFEEANHIEATRILLVAFQEALSAIETPQDFVNTIKHYMAFVKLVLAHLQKQ